MSTLVAVPFNDISRPRASTLGSNFRRGGRNYNDIKTKSLHKNSASAKPETRSIMTIFGGWRKRLERDSHEDALARLTEELDSIRDNLSSLRTEGRAIEQRVASVTAEVDEIVFQEQEKRQSLEVIAESDCESQEDEEEVETSQIRSKYTSTISLSLSNRDSGYITDPAFEMTDPQKYCLLNNSKLPSAAQKTRSTSAIDFIKNDLHDDRRTHLKATSYDRLSCLSDSALATYAVRHRIL